jgi:hypothetical protein
MEKKLKSLPDRRGFDAAVTAREHDYLGRWPFAQEIYGIATTGPRGWSVRVGVYGEWGTGKTSILEFVDLMAEADGHVLVRFNPWQFSSTNELWRALVKIIFENIEQRLGTSQPGKTGRSIKRFFGRAAIDAPKFIGLWRKEAATAVETGVSYVKRFLTFGPGDLSELKQSLGDRRIIVLIDDLDRTDPKLVPEMLFALKEIMDVPGMAFVCAFDPTIVGKVLGQLHPGFGEGLDFLEKIIDYPRWLPQPTVGQLVRLAAADADEYCPYVPKPDLEEVISLLPANPRSIRQFVRLLRLLRPQIDRHRPDEIRWPILLAANTIKVRFPQIAHEIFGNENFWHSVYQSSGMGNERRDDTRKTIVDEETKRLAERYKLDKSTKEDLNRCLWAIARRLEIWSGIPYEAVTYQFHLAELPAAVTWKEFDDFLSDLGPENMSAEFVANWIDAHALKQGRSEGEVFNELLDAATRARLSEFAKAADTSLDTEMRAHMETASRLLQLLSVLILDLGQIDGEPRVGVPKMEALLESIAKYFSWRTAEPYREAHDAEEAFLLEIATRWGREILPLVDALEVRGLARDEISGREWGDLVRRLCEIVNPKFASWIISRFQHDPDFVAMHLNGSERGYKIKALLLDKNGAIWNGRRDEILGALNTAPSNDAVRGNAYEFLRWVDYLLRRSEPDAPKASDLLSDRENALSLWQAATAHALNLRAVGTLRGLLQRLRQNGFEWDEPEWWRREIANLEEHASERGPAHAS